MTIYEDREVTKIERIAIKKVCDICEEESKNLKTISHNHHNWGNDSIDSYETIEICDNPECYKGAFKKFEESCNAKYRTAEFDGMEYSKLKILLSKG